MCDLIFLAVQGKCGESNFLSRLLSRVRIRRLKFTCHIKKALSSVTKPDPGKYNQFHFKTNKNEHLCLLQSSITLTRATKTGLRTNSHRANIRCL